MKKLCVMAAVLILLLTGCASPQHGESSSAPPPGSSTPAPSVEESASPSQTPSEYLTEGELYDGLVEKWPEIEVKLSAQGERRSMTVFVLASLDGKSADELSGSFIEAAAGMADVVFSSDEMGSPPSGDSNSCGFSLIVDDESVATLLVTKKDGELNSMLSVLRSKSEIYEDALEAAYQENTLFSWIDMSAG
ncbi:hypothetical protein [Clostridium sp. D33t1_170424_F3]|uniref:hypothetical protein n=1 Tax=Clostridium sp. D33t1_170424_F3 TaxID=2787099 RepID=UPI0018AA47FB|nr:hypothetical protein [Clostridium sp. D33t1_170424_F3]